MRVDPTAPVTAPLPMARLRAKAALWRVIYALGLYRRIRIPIGDTLAHLRDRLRHPPPPSAPLPVAPRNGSRRLLLDVSGVARMDIGTGIQRVVRGLSAALLHSPPPGWQVVLVAGRSDAPGFRIAAGFTARLMGRPAPDSSDPSLIPAAGDLYLALDLQPGVIRANAETFATMRRGGVQVAALLHDLLPLQMPQHFPAADVAAFRGWLAAVAGMDRVFCTSHCGAMAFADWLAGQGIAGPRIDWFHLGGDLDGAPRTTGPVRLPRFPGGTEFLMVGTVEPRKAHALVLDGLDRLWAEGAEVNLLVIGRRGWMNQTTIRRLRTHPMAGRRLVWMADADDATLTAAYARADALIGASEGEGFGLPVIEAARHGIPLILRDIPIFREIAGKHATFFAPDDLPGALRRWIADHAAGRTPRTDGLVPLSWAESAARLSSLLPPDGIDPPAPPAAPQR